MFANHIFVYDPLMVFGFCAIGLVAVLAGAAICIFVVCYTHRKKVKARSKTTWKKLRGKVHVAGMHYDVHDLSAHGHPTSIAFSVGQLRHDQLVEAGELATKTTLAPSKKTFFTIGRRWTSEQIKSQNSVAPEPEIIIAQPVAAHPSDGVVQVVEGHAPEQVKAERF